MKQLLQFVQLALDLCHESCASHRAIFMQASLVASCQPLCCCDDLERLRFRTPLGIAKHLASLLVQVSAAARADTRSDSSLDAASQVLGLEKTGLLFNSVVTGSRKFSASQCPQLKGFFLVCKAFPSYIAHVARLPRRAVDRQATFNPTPEAQLKVDTAALQADAPLRPGRRCD